jgi:hypothetical protein
MRLGNRESMSAYTRGCGATYIALCVLQYGHDHEQIPGALGNEGCRGSGQLHRQRLHSEARRRVPALCVRLG